MESMESLGIPWNHLESMESMESRRIHRITQNP
jgi:hypothetical protein